MDFFSALTLFIILFIIFSLCGFCCRSKRKGTIFSKTRKYIRAGILFGCIIFILSCFWLRYYRKKKKSPVVVTSATHTAPGGYPTGVQAVSVYPATYQQNVYPQQAPYPVSGASTGMPMPQPQMQPHQMGMNQHVMPPYPTAGPGMNPPSYDTAVASPNTTIPNPNQAAYEKQSPYNPNYATGY